MEKLGEEKLAPEIFYSMSLDKLFHPDLVSKQGPGKQGERKWGFVVSTSLNRRWKIYVGTQCKLHRLWKYKTVMTNILSDYLKCIYKKNVSDINKHF